MKEKGLAKLYLKLITISKNCKVKALFLLREIPIFFMKGIATN